MAWKTKKVMVSVLSACTMVIASASAQASSLIADKSNGAESVAVSDELLGDALGDALVPDASAAMADDQPPVAGASAQGAAGGGTAGAGAAGAGVAGAAAAEAAGAVAPQTLLLIGVVGAAAAATGVTAATTDNSASS